MTVLQYPFHIVSPQPTSVNGNASPRPGDKFIDHPSAIAAKHRVVSHIRNGLHAGGADIMALMGPSGSGKTEIVKDIMSLREFQVTQAPDGREIQPIVYVETANSETPKSLAIAILRAMGDYKPERGTQASIQARAAGILQGKGVRLLIIDEAQLLSTNLYDAGDFFRQFINQPIVPVLLVGLPSIGEMIKANAQVGRRASPNIHLSAFDWKNKVERQIFLGVLKTILMGLPDPFNKVPMDFATLARAFYITSGGLIGRLTQLLRVALDMAIDRNSSELALELLADAYDKVKDLYQDPFENAFRTKFLPSAIKKAADSIGMRTSAC